MTQKEHEKEYQRAGTAKELEATQLVSLDDLQELEQMELACPAEPARQHRTLVVLGSALSLVLTAGLLAAALLRNGGYSQ